MNNKKYTKADLVSFGNFLLSKERKELIFHEINADQVTDSDLSHWESMNGFIKEDNKSISDEDYFLERTALKKEEIIPNGFYIVTVGPLVLASYYDPSRNVDEYIKYIIENVFKMNFMIGVMYGSDIKLYAPTEEEIIELKDTLAYKEYLKNQIGGKAEDTRISLKDTTVNIVQANGILCAANKEEMVLHEFLGSPSLTHFNQIPITSVPKDKLFLEEVELKHIVEGDLLYFGISKTYNNLSEYIKVTSLEEGIITGYYHGDHNNPMKRIVWRVNPGETVKRVVLDK